MMETEKCTLKMEEETTRQHSQLLEAKEARRLNLPSEFPKRTSAASTLTNEINFRLMTSRTVSI